MNENRVIELEIEEGDAMSNIDICTNDIVTVYRGVTDIKGCRPLLIKPKEEHHEV